MTKHLREIHWQQFLCQPSTSRVPGTTKHLENPLRRGFSLARVNSRVFVAIFGSPIILAHMNRIWGFFLVLALAGFAWNILALLLSAAGIYVPAIDPGPR